MFEPTRPEQYLRASELYPDILAALDIGVEFLEPEVQLAGIKAFRAAAELAPLELANDETKLLDLAVAPVFLGDQIAHQLVQQACVVGQIRKIESHERFYAYCESTPTTCCDSTRVF